MWHYVNPVAVMDLKMTIYYYYYYYCRCRLISLVIHVFFFACMTTLLGNSLICSTFNGKSGKKHRSSRLTLQNCNKLIHFVPSLFFFRSNFLWRKCMKFLQRKTCHQLIDVLQTHVWRVWWYTVGAALLSLLVLCCWTFVIVHMLSYKYYKRCIYLPIMLAFVWFWICSKSKELL